MNLPELVEAVTAIFGDESEVVVMVSDIVRWANDGQLALARRTEALASVQAIDVVAGDDSYPVAADFLLENRVTFNGYGLARVTERELNQYYPDRDVAGNGGSITSYNISNRSLNVHPTPTETEVGVGNLKLEYVRRPATLEMNVNHDFDLPPEMHEELVDYCLMRAKELDDDLASADYYQKAFQAKSGISAADSQYPYTDSYPSVREV